MGTAALEVSLDGEEPLPLVVPVDASRLAARLRSCTEFWIVGEAQDGRNFVQFAPQPEGDGVFEHWRGGRCLFSERRTPATAEAEAVRFAADPIGYRVKR